MKSNYDKCLVGKNVADNLYIGSTLVQVAYMQAEDGYFRERIKKCLEEIEDVLGEMYAPPMNPNDVADALEVYSKVMRTSITQDWVQLTREDILALPSGDHKVKVKLERLSWPEAKTIYVGDATLRIIRRDKSLKVGKKLFPAGEIISIALIDYDWAEYDAKDISKEGYMSVEDYGMGLYK